MFLIDYVIGIFKLLTVNIKIFYWYQYHGSFCYDLHTSIISFLSRIDLLKLHKKTFTTSPLAAFCTRNEILYPTPIKDRYPSSLLFLKWKILSVLSSTLCCETLLSYSKSLFLTSITIVVWCLIVGSRVAIVKIYKEWEVRFYHQDIWVRAFVLISLIVLLIRESLGK